MNILLLGELIGFHASLKTGLVNLCHEVNIAGYTEGCINSTIDFNLDSK